MSNFLRASYYWVDLLIGFGCPLVLVVFRVTARLPSRFWRYYWLGVLLCATGEIPIFLLSEYGSRPVIVWVRELPAPFWVFLIAHTLADGLLFLVGMWLVERLCRTPVLERFRWQELALLVGWGQVSSLAVELSSVLSGGWVYVESYWWNPPLFHVAGRPIVLLTQAAWLIIPVVFYLIVLVWKKRERDRR